MRIEQHLVRLRRVGPQHEGEAVTQLEVRHLKFDRPGADLPQLSLQLNWKASPRT